MSTRGCLRACLFLLLLAAVPGLAQSGSACPTNDEVVDVFAIGQSEAVFLCYQKSINQTTATLIELTTQHQSTLVKAESIDVFPKLSSDTFALLLRQKTQRLLLYSGSRLTKELSGEFYGPVIWSRNSDFLYIGAGMTEQAEGFNVLGILDLKTGTFTKRKLRNPTEALTADCGSPVHLYVFGDDPYGSNPTADVYHAHGSLEHRAGSRYPVFSANCKYSTEFLSLHGPADWSIFDNSTQTVVRKFKWSDTHANLEKQFVAWNPVFDHVALLRDFGVRDTPHLVFDIEKNSTLRSLGPIAAWLPDGRSVISVAHNRYNIERVVP